MVRQVYNCEHIPIYESHPCTRTNPQHQAIRAQKLNARFIVMAKHRQNPSDYLWTTKGQMVVGAGVAYRQQLWCC